MRLTRQEINAIRETVLSLDPAAEIRLFGSRAIPHAKGGDIDLLIFSKDLTQEDASRIRHQLWEKIGEQKIDLIIASDTSQPFVRIALKESREI